MDSEPRSARSYFLFYMILSFDDSSSFLGSEIVPGGIGLIPLTDSTTIDGTSTVESHSTNSHLIRTHVSHGQFRLSRRKAHIFSLVRENG